jgi:hypothetical protein
MGVLNKFYQAGKKAVDSRSAAQFASPVSAGAPAPVARKRSSVAGTDLVPGGKILRAGIAKRKQIMGDM